MVGWHHHLNGHEFEQITGDSEGQGSLACCCCSHAFQETNSLRRTMQIMEWFITPADPRQSLLLAEDLDQLL